MLMLAKAGYSTPDVKVVKTMVHLDNKSHKYLKSELGQLDYDLVYGLTTQLADQLKDYVTLTETYDKENDEWECVIELKVVNKDYE